MTTDEGGANPLLERWMKEKWEQARERNSKGALIYKKAYESLIRCPTKFAHPSEAICLIGVGPKLVDWLTEKMNEHCDASGLPRPKKTRDNTKRGAEIADLSQEVVEEPNPEPPAKKAKKVKQYIPKPRSGAYALIMALSAQTESKRSMVKSELQREAQPFCDSSFTIPSDPTKFYTAWKSIETLLNKELVCIVGKPVNRYSLTDEGWEVARQIRAVEGSSLPVTVARSQHSRKTNDQTYDETARMLGSRDPPQQSPIVTDLEHNPEPMRRPPGNRDRPLQVELELAEKASVRSDTLPEFEPVCVPSGNFTVELILDNREVRTPADRDYISIELQKMGVKPIIRSLPVGDALWIAKVDPVYADLLASANPNEEGECKDEIVLDYIMERKRLDDLISSIKDGRFREQKFRLRKSGAKHVIYLVEEYSISSERSETYGDSLESAIAGMQIANGFFVKQTSKLDETVRYLAEVTKSLRVKYGVRDLKIIPSHVLEGCNFPSALTAFRERRPDIDPYVTFSAFTGMCDKSDSLTLRDVFLKMLMCIRGVTGEKAIEIQRKWPTPKAFIDAFAATHSDEARKSVVGDQLAELIPRKKIAKALSSKIAEVWA